jgi:hypothetical protein
MATPPPATPDNGDPAAVPPQPDALDRLTERLRDVSPADAHLSSRPDDATVVGAAATAAPLLPPALLRLQSYTVIAPLGRGGMGAVYLAHPRGLPDKRVALKVLPSLFALDDGRRQRFATEATTASRIEHPNVVKVLAVGDEDGVHFQIQELAPDGRTLADRIREARDARTLPKDWHREMAALFAQVADGMAAVHAANVLHRDLKPSNILLLPDGTPKVADFGLAKDLEAGDGVTGSISPGTLNYQSPEQLDRRFGAVGERSDVFALGVTLYEALMLTRLFLGDTPAEVRQQILEREVDDLRLLRPSVPADLSVICRTCLEKEPSRRYPTMAAVAADLRRHLRHEPIAAKPAGLALRARKWVRRNQAASAVLATVTAGLVAVGWMAWVIQQRADENEKLALEKSALATEATRAKDEALAQKQLAADAATANAKLAQEKGALADQERRLRADQLLAGADLLARQSAWEPCLAQLAAARATGVLAESELLLREADANLARNDVKSAADCLARHESLPDRKPLGRAALLRARIAVSTGEGDATVRAAVQQAQELGLDAAEAAFAEGLLADTPAAAHAAFDRTIRLAPHWREAHDQRISASFARLRMDLLRQAVAECELLYPDDPAVPVAHAVEAALHGNSELTEAALARLPGTSLAGDYGRLMAAMFLACQQLPIECFIGDSIGLKTSSEIAKVMGSISQAIRKVAKLQRTESGSRVPVMSDLGGLRDTGAALYAMFCHVQPNFRPMVALSFAGLAWEPMPLGEARQRLQAISADGGEAMADYLFGVEALNRVHSAKVRADFLAVLLDAYAHFRRGAAARSLLIAMPRACRHQGLRCIEMMPAELRAPEVSAAVAWVLQALGEECSPIERRQQSATAMAIERADLALAVARRAAAEGVDAAEVARMECDALLALGGYEAVTALLSRLADADRAQVAAALEKRRAGAPAAGK